MKTAINTILVTAASATAAFAANGGQGEEPGILMWAFLGFCAFILVGQLVPSVLLLIGMVKGMLSPASQVKSN